ncbi:MAG: Gfo/Idh/MocA family oxidoreductase [Planctomycetes bacterium]|nr:Gfo/Idh/MocA family oxidoreductase [Planctomycetota bacterium]
MPPKKKLGIGVIGLGFMGRTHLSAYHAAERDGLPCEVVAVCDRDRRAPNSVGEGNLRFAFKENELYDPARVKRYESADELLADPRVGSVSICTNTESHAELAIAALRAGKHVICEKPVALDLKTVRRVRDAAKNAQTLCMPAMCMRFWPGWNWLKQQIINNTHGKVVSASFERLSSPPNWSKKFYRDPARTGGALVDLHIHDADLTAWLFGMPDSVSSAGSLDHVTTLYHYKRGPAHVSAHGGWNHSLGFPFRMRYVVIFERATAEFDLLREEKLILSKNGECTSVALPPGTGYDGEIRHFVETVMNGKSKKVLAATLDDAVNVTELLAAERKSIESGKIVYL